jgi:hypothetical protein
MPNFGSLGQVVSAEKNFRNQPIRNKNCLWRPCLPKDPDEMSNIYRGLPIDASVEKIKMWKVSGRRTTEDIGQTTVDEHQVMAKAHIYFGKVN